MGNHGIAMGYFGKIQMGNYGIIGISVLGLSIPND
jgi:hypothetical protein